MEILAGLVPLDIHIKWVAMTTCYRMIGITQVNQSNVNAYKYFFCNRICDTWNALPHTVVEAPSLNTFKRLLNNVAVCHVAVLP